MDNQVIKLCGVCGNKRVYIEHHSLYNPCKISVAKILARYHQANREKILATYKLYQENTKYRRKSHRQQIEELNTEVEELTRTMETINLKTEKV